MDLEAILQFDSSILLWIQNSVRGGFLTPVMKVITHLGDKGIFWILVTLALVVVMNLAIHRYTGIANIAGLPARAGAILVGISMLLTLIAGLIPSRLAAKKDPVVALRTE